MRVLLAFSLFSLSLAADRAMNIPCNRELDGLLAVDPDGNSSAFLSCRVTGDGNIGIWERNFCPYNMIFDFINQQCKTVAMRKQHRKPQSNLNIAILNSSCAKGETCIGGTVCDRDTLRCLCPFGTIPQLETLSCVKNENAFNPERFKFSFENVNKNGNFLPNPNQPINMNNNNGQPGFIPNPNFNKFNPNNYNSNNFANNNNLGNSQWQTNSPATSSNNFGGMMPNHKFVFGNFGGVTTQAPTTKRIPILVGIGAICNDLAECDNGSVCQMGRCACVSPLVQYEGKCVLRQERKEVGPGELCDNGEVCVKGSICDSIIPVCVCPSDTDLSNGECVHVYKPNGATKSTYSESTVPPTLAPIQTTARPVATAAPVYIPATTTKTIPPVYTFNQNIVQQPSTTYGYKNVATQQPTSKPNHMKISLGGSKQSGVGVRCSLNTDCMIGAYCNGNTSPPSCQCLSTHVNIESRCEKELDLCIPACVPPLICSYNICICPDETNCQTQLMLIGKKKISNLDSVESRTNMQTISFHKRSRRQTNGLVCWPDATTCSDGHGVCISNKCHCINGLVPRDGFCRPVLLPVDSSCDVENLSAVCEDGAFCIDGFCRCQKPGGCLMSVSMCESHSQCPQTFICVGGRCVCDTNFVVKNGQCHPTSQNDVLIYKGINNICNIKTDRCSGGSVCKGGVCICTDDSVEKMGRCHQNPGGRCSNGQTCVNGSICELGRCNCPDGHVISTRDPTMCIVAASEAGKSCQLGEVCIHGSVCRFGICMCVAKKVNVNGRCVKKDSIPIKVNKIPTTTPTPSTTLKTTTSLPPSTVTTTLPVTTYISESTISSFNSNCTLFEICNGSSSCAGEICPCKDNEIVVDEKCVGDMELMPISAPGQPCNAETTCTGGSICINELCRCESGVLNAQGFCELPSTPPSLNPTETPLKVHTSGQKAKKSSSSSDELLPGMECLLTVQCPFRTECRQGVCRCRHGETIVDGTCRQAIHQVRVGGACNPQKGYDCIGESFCTYGACTCFHQMHSSNGLCVPRSQLNPVIPTKRCDSESYCIGGSRCQEGICRCGYDEVPDVNNKCVKKSSVYPIMKPTTTITPPTTTLRIPGLGESCIFSCTEGVCRGGICIDLEAEMERLELELKQNPAKSAVADVATNDRSTSEDLLLEGTHCAKDSDCPLSSRCLQGICFCNAGYRATAGYCEQISALGSSCISTNQCPLHAVCVQGTCQCASSLRDGKACRPPRLGRPGDQCHNDVICSYNSYCGLMSGVCECPSGMATERGECRQTALTTGKACVTSRNCHRFSYCDNGFCLCKSGYELVNDFCMPPPKRLLLNEIDEQPNQNLETQRNDGPQSPMQERIRTETFMQNMAGTNSIFGPVNSGDTSQSLTSNQLLSPNVLQPMTGTQSNMATLPIDLTKPPFNYSKNMNVQVFMATTSGPSTQTPATPFSSFNPIFAPNSFTPTFTPNMDNPFAAQFASFPIVNGAPIVSGDSSTASSSAINISPPKMRFAMPGEYCGDQALCLGNSFCTQDFCRCPDQCSAQNGICAYKYQDGIKVYDSDYLSKEDDDEAIDRKHLNASEERQFAQPLENCQNFEFCVGGSECLQLAAGLGLLCQCPVGLIYLQDECIEAPKAIDLVGIGEACGKNQLCLGGSICEDDKCVCRGGRRNILGICVYTAHPGDDCSNGQLCVDGSVCAGIKRTCICPPGKRSLLGRCVEQDGPEDEFAATMKEDGSENMIPHRHLTSAYPGENCSDSRTICMDNSKCANDLTCQCQPRFFNVDGRCVPSDMVRQPYESCSMTQICVTGSRCIEGFCQCADGLLGVDDRCIPVSNEIRRHELSKINSNSLTEVTNTPNGPICDENEDCPLHFRCHERLCVCHGSSSECLSIMLLSVDAQCSEDLQCPLNSKCNEGICICSDGYRMDADRCVVRHSQMAASPTLLHRLPMFAHEDPPADTSTLPSLPRIPTTPSSNQLPDNLVLNRIPSISVPTVTADPVMASRLLSSFLNALSQASESMRFSDAMLTTPAALPTLESIISSTSTMTVFSVPGQPCSVPNRICGNNGICFKDYCICSYDYIPINDSCIPRDGHIRFGHPCSDVHRCNEGLICLHDKCACSPEDITCDPNEPVTSPPGGSCTDARECTGGSVCREGWCICPDPSMIVQKGICIQSGIRPTLPPKTVPVYTTSIPTAPVYQTASVLSVTNKPAQPQVNTFNALPSTIHQGRKVTPGNQCGPLDSCVGGSMCLDGLCVCPQGTHASQNGRCESTTTTTQTTTKAAVSSTTPGLAKPGEDCSDGQTCTGGSTCNDDWDCACPSHKPLIKDGTCVEEQKPQTRRQAVPGESCDANTDCINGSSCHSGQCRCAPQFVALSGFCVQMPMSTTPQMKTFAKPLESCENGETCEGGSKCDDDTLICMCPRGQVAFGVECKVPPGASVSQMTTQETISNPATTECENDNNCGEGKLCVAGRCRCRPGTVDNAGVCELLEEIEIGERPIPISYARHRVLSEKQKPASGHAEPEIQQSQSSMSSEYENQRVIQSTTLTPLVTVAARAPARAEGQKPRVVGPPIRRPKPKPKTTSSSGSGSGTGSVASYKTGGSGNGNCPPGNEATRDSYGKLILCNGLEPNCPPRSYCYITSGGFATEEYNCCKSW